MSDAYATTSMDRHALRRLLDEWFCGCGSPKDATASLLRLLELHPLYEHRAELDAWIPDDGVQYLLLYMLDHLELTEHGGSVGGGWLTPKGKATMAALRAEQADGFDALHDNHCVHGYSMDEIDAGDHGCT